MSLRYPLDVPVLTDGDSIALRAHRADDLAAIIEQCTDPDMVRFTTVPWPYRVEDAHDFLERTRTDWEQHSPTSRRTWAITVGASGDKRFAGTVDYRPTGHATATVGYGLHPAHRGRGLMSKALGLVLNWAFEHDGQELMKWEAVVGNWASAKTVWRHGFRLEGCVRGFCVHPGGAFDGWIATLHRDDPRTPCQPWPWPDGHSENS
jgi:RimJ/RimL family protein N-acetyltransferase